jgi:hypothetical protein
MSRAVPGATPIGAVRRIRALASCGWSPSAIEAETGFPARVAARALSYPDAVSNRHTAAAAAAYEQLWNRQPPQATAAEQRAAEEMRERAHRYAPPLAWDDDQLDRPEGRPADGWRRSSGSTLRSRDIAEDVDFVRREGGYAMASVAEIAVRLGLSRTHVEKALSRAAQYRARDADREAG